MSASPLIEDRAAVPAVPPDRRPTWPRWRPALRLAIRDARGNRGRTALVVALVALPVALVVGMYLFGTSRTWGDLQKPRELLGAVAAGSAEPVMPAPTAGWADALPDGWRLVPWPVVQAVEGSPMYLDSVGGTAGDFNDPVVRGLVELRTGRVPMSVDEVVITPDLAVDRGLEIGDTWTTRIGDLVSVSDAPVVPLSVVGIGDVAGRHAGGSFVLGAVPPGWAIRTDGGDRFLVDSPTA